MAALTWAEGSMRLIGFILAALLAMSPSAFAQARDAVRIEEGVSAKVRDALNRAVPNLLRLYAALLDGEPRGAPAVSVVWRNRADAQRSVQAGRDAGDGVGITLSGRDWADPAPEAIASLLEATAHELAHIWNASIYRADSDLPAWVTQGNSELLGTAALLRLGLATPGETARRVNVALNTCFAFAGGGGRAAVSGREPEAISNACGLAIQFVLVALAQRRDPSVDAFAFWRGLWKAHPRYGMGSIAEHVAATFPGDAAQFLASVGEGSSVPLDASLVGGIRSALGIELPTAPPEVYASQVLNNLMLHDCGGRAGFWTNNDHLFTDELPGCKFFKAGWKIRYMAGRDLLREPLEAVRDAKAACARDKSLMFRTLDGREFPMPCDDAVAAVLPSDLRVANLPPLRVARVLSR
jgi:hypothetical protein